MRAFLCSVGQAVAPLALLLLVSACVQIGTRHGQVSPPAATLSSPQPQISLFVLSGREQTTSQVRLQVAAIELSVGGQWVSLVRQPITVTSAQAASGFMLDRVQVPTGRYGLMRYRLSQAVVVRDGRETLLQLPPQPIEYPLPQPLTLKDGDSLSLFLNWDVAASLAKAPQFSPAIYPALQHIPLTTELAYVSCPEINTVYVIRTDQNRVCGSWGITGRPTYLHAVKERNVLYVLAAEQAAIKGVELTSGRVQERIRIPMAVKPSFMAMDREGNNAYLLDQATDTVYRVDLAAGSLAAQGRVGEQLDFAVFIDDEKRLAVSSERSQQVLLLDASTLAVRQTIPVGSAPQGILGYGHDLYVAEGRANTVSKHQAGTGTTLRQPVGLGPSRLLAHGRTIFVANAQGGSITILLPEQLTVLEEISIGGTPGEMDVAPGRNWLYVVDAKGKGVAVLDLTTHRPVTRIDLNSPPLDIEVVP